MVAINADHLLLLNSSLFPHSNIPNGALTLSVSNRLFSVARGPTDILEDLTITSPVLGANISFLLAAMSMDDTLLSNAINSILESISMGVVALTNGSNYHSDIQEALDHSDLVLGVIALIIQEDLTIDDIVANYQLYSSVIDEVCNTHDINLTTGLLHIVLAVALTISSIISNLNELLSEQITVDDNLLQVLFSFLSILEDASISDTSLDTLSIFSILNEDITESDTSTNNVSLNTSIAEALSVMIGANLNGITYEGWLLNPENFAVWNYNNFNFNSVTDFNEQYLLANNTGLYKLTGTSDNGAVIISKLLTASLDFGTSNLKQVSDLILGLTNSGRIVLKVFVDGEQTAYYELKPGTRNLQNQRIKIGKGLYGRYWQFEIITKNNSTLDLDTFEILPFLFKRKLR